MLHFYQFMIVYSQINKKYMALTKIDISSRNKVNTANHHFGFFNVAIEEK